MYFLRSKQLCKKKTAEEPSKISYFFSAHLPTFFRYLLYIYIFFYIYKIKNKSGQVGKKPEKPYIIRTFSSPLSFLKAGRNRATGHKFNQNIPDLIDKTWRFQKQSGLLPVFQIESGLIFFKTYNKNKAKCCKCTSPFQ